MDLDTARQLLQDFELILSIAQQGIATIHEFTEGPDFAPEAPLNLTIEDLTNSPPTPLLAPPDGLNEQLPEDPGEQLLADHDEQFPDHWAPPTPPSPLTTNELVAHVTRPPHALWHPNLPVDNAKLPHRPGLIPLLRLIPKPREEEIDLLRSLKINTKAKHAWSVIATRLSRTVEDCKTQWALHK